MYIYIYICISLNPKHETPKTKQKKTTHPRTHLGPKPSTLNPQTLNPQPSTLN